MIHRNFYLICYRIKSAGGRGKQSFIKIYMFFIKLHEMLYIRSVIHKLIFIVILISRLQLT